MKLPTNDEGLSYQAMIDKAAQYDLISLYYDLFKSSITCDVGLYLEFAKKTKGPVLELACGTGRLAIELAKAGFDVTGIDISPKMLMCFRRKLDALPDQIRKRIELVEVDMRQYQPTKRFGLIFVALDSWFQIKSEEDRVRILRNCHSHLKSDGYLVIDVFLNDIDEHREWGERRPDGRVFYDGSWSDPSVAGGVIQRFRSDVMDVGTLHLHRTVFCDHVSPEGAVRRVTISDDEYYVPHDQLEAELRDAGFKHVNVYGGYEKQPLYDPSLKGQGRQIFVGQP